MNNFTSIGKKIVAIGRNFSDHAKELGSTVPKSPFFFLKPTSSYLLQGGSVELPKGSEVHHEVELGVVIGKNGRDIIANEAFDYVAGYALGIDLTARDLQNEVIKKGLPWSAAKGFDTFTPIGDFIPKDLIKDPSNVNLWLKVNGQMKQNGSTKDMVFKIPTLIEHISSIMRLEKGDLILTGTPSGVGPIFAGDVMIAGLNVGDKTLSRIEFPVLQRNRLNKL
ncbi:putative mitochondrion protein [Gigaspora margarita]|uniref:Putative mitochondrion protein n=1 Tax=Gigaspora margarita TaxID=4874 RepID=A0A8H3XD89_GIGMA|nr:putative mitochondrion protein [Gigaspora margarita]